MRLTLRTLLAWSDGVLAPEEQRFIGERVAASRVATRLIERIRAVAACGPVDPPGPSVGRIADDPNLVAEYLDNTLAADYLEAFERTCIESSRHLAEVGACHRLLAEIVHRPELEHGLLPERRREVRDRVFGGLTGGGARHAAAGPGPGPVPRAEELPTLRRVARGVVPTHMAAAAVSPAVEPAVSPPASPAVEHGSVAVAAPVAAARWPQRGRTAWVAWLSACAALTLLLALGGVLASFGRTREFRPEPGCLRCTEP